MTASQMTASAIAEDRTADEISSTVRGIARKIVDTLPAQDSVDGAADAMTALSLAMAHVYLGQCRGRLGLALTTLPSAPLERGVSIAMLSIFQKPL